MKTLKNIFILFILILLLSCVTKSIPSDQDITNIDDLINVIADKTILNLPVRESSNLAVYYFSVDGRESSISDYLINGLTSEIANKVPSGYKVVSRKGLDRVMEEYSLQLSDLVSEETQVDIGELLGADTIITGFITSFPDRDNINIQIIDVLSGAVISGFSIDYKLKGDFGREYSSETLTVSRKYEKSTGIATITTIYETFDNAISEINPSHFEDFWGERIISTSAETGVDPEGFAYMDFHAEFDSIDLINNWNDSDITFYMDLPLNQIPESSNGIYVKIRPENYSRIYIIIKQEKEGEVSVFGAPVNLNPNEWNSLNIPYNNLRHIDGEKEIDKNSNISVLISIPYRENAEQFYFKENKSLNSRISIDEIGLYSLKTEEIKNKIATFEDEINQVLISYYADGTYSYTDYTIDDSGIIRLNKGIDSQKLKVDIVEDGPVGSYLQFSGSFEVNEDIKDFIENWGEVLLVLDMNTGKDLSSYETLSFIVSSDTVESGYIAINDPQRGKLYESVFQINKSWSRTKLPLSRLETDDGDKGSGKEDPLLLRLMWKVPENKLKEAAQTGVLKFTIGLDEMILE